MRFQFKLRTAILLMLLVSALLFAAIRLFRPIQRRSHIALINSTGKTIQDVAIVTQPYGTTERHAKRVMQLADGAQLLMDVDGDVAVDLYFDIDGRKVSHSEGYVDLWPGDTFVFDFDGDGKLARRYGILSPDAAPSRK
jgi:hypothetical protein